MKYILFLLILQSCYSCGVAQSASAEETDQNLVALYLDYKEQQHNYDDRSVVLEKFKNALLKNLKSDAYEEVYVSKVG